VLERNDANWLLSDSHEDSRAKAERTNEQDDYPKSKTYPFFIGFRKVSMQYQLRRTKPVQLAIH